MNVVWAHSMVAAAINLVVAFSFEAMLWGETKVVIVVCLQMFRTVNLSCPPFTLCVMFLLFARWTDFFFWLRGVAGEVANGAI